MTHFLGDILAEPDELRGTLRHTLGPGRDALRAAAQMVAEAPSVVVTGIGSSWHAGMAVAAQFAAAGRAATLHESSELLHFGVLLPGSAVIVLSRSGRSVEIVGLLDKARESGARIVAVTNTPDSPLAAAADVVLLCQAAFDHNVSVTMYSAVGLVAGLLVQATCDQPLDDLGASLEQSLLAAKAAVPSWQAALAASDWPGEGPIYFLARGASLASAHEASLLWEEACKLPAAAMATGNFRHGPQECLAPDMRVALWLDAKLLREEDLALAADLRRYDAKALLIGHDIDDGAADLVLPLPETPPGWQFLVDCLPIQLAAEELARRRGADCDEFRICPYVIESEGGLSA